MRGIYVDAVEVDGVNAKAFGLVVLGSEVLEGLEEVLGLEISVLYDLPSLRNHVFVDDGGVLLAVRSPRNFREGLVRFIGVHQECVLCIDNGLPDGMHGTQQGGHVLRRDAGYFRIWGGLCELEDDWSRFELADARDFVGNVAGLELGSSTNAHVLSS